MSNIFESQLIKDSVNLDSSIAKLLIANFGKLIDDSKEDTTMTIKAIRKLIAQQITIIEKAQQAITLATTRLKQLNEQLAEHE